MKTFDTGSLKADKDFQRVKQKFDYEAKHHQKQIKELQAMLESAFQFIVQAWGNHQEMVYFLTELTAGTDSILFINRWGCDAYFQYNQELLTYDQEAKLKMEAQKFVV